MSELTQERLDKAHDALDRAIKLVEALANDAAGASVEACNEGQLVARDRLGAVSGNLCMALGSLRIAKSQAGQLNLSGGIQPRSGGK